MNSIHSVIILNHFFHSFNKRIQIYNLFLAPSIETLINILTINFSQPIETFINLLHNLFLYRFQTLDSSCLLMRKAWRGCWRRSPSIWTTTTDSTWRRRKGKAQDHSQTEIDRTWAREEVRCVFFLVCLPNANV